MPSRRGLPLGVMIRRDESDKAGAAEMGSKPERCVIWAITALGKSWMKQGKAIIRLWRLFMRAYFKISLRTAEVFEARFRF